MNFNNISELCELIDKHIGNDFIQRFQKTYKELKSNKRLLRLRLLGNVHDDERWAINQGGNTEIQYHISFDDNNINYGLGFSMQYVPFQSDRSPVDHLRPFIKAFFSIEKEIMTLLPNYDFIHGERGDLVRPKDKSFVLLGDRIKIKKNDGIFTVSEESFASLIQDLKKQFLPYKMIYSVKNANINTMLRNTEYSDILQNVKPQLILQGAPGTGKTYKAEEISYLMIFEDAISMIKDQREKDIQKMHDSGQYAFVQFHPAYSYEDFIRGISAKPNGGLMEYKAVNKVFADFAAIANRNLIDSRKPAEEINKEEWTSQMIEKFLEYIEAELAEKGRVALTEGAAIHRLNNNTIRYTGENWTIDGGVPFTDLQEMYLHNVHSLQDVKQLSTLTLSAKGNSTYWFRMVELFRAFLQKKDLKQPKESGERVKLKRFVFVIDEINRANLPAVLGELIYALEYRDRPVKPIYDLEEGENMIIVPSNLYIIGTMNTADRSVGHIDYAIRRRFAFKDIYADENIITFPPAKALFREIRKLFVRENDLAIIYLSSEYREKDLMLGHSYFMSQDLEKLQLKLNYEIFPILEEYVRDGILTDLPKHFKKTCDDLIAN